MICRRCLLSDMEAEKPLYQLIQEVIAAMDEDEKTPEALYQKRLAACKACERLMGGMCALCGCYVEVRAAKKGQRCPDTNPKWRAISDITV